jgi:hypothetical protein
VEDIGAGVGVEVAGGFVGEEDGGIDGEGAGDGDALAFAAGEFVGEVVGSFGEANEVEEFVGAVAGFAAVPATEVEGEGDVFFAGEGGEEVKELEDEADFVAADAGEVVIGEPGEADAVDGDMAGGGGVESADEVEEGGLAGAGGSDEGDHFALGDGEGDAGEGDDFALAVEFLGEVGDIDHGEVLVLLKRMPEGRGWTEKSGGRGAAEAIGVQSRGSGVGNEGDRKLLGPRHQFIVWLSIGGGGRASYTREST